MIGIILKGADLPKIECTICVRVQHSSFNEEPTFCGVFQIAMDYGKGERKFIVLTSCKVV